MNLYTLQNARPAPVLAGNAIDVYIGASGVPENASLRNGAFDLAAERKTANTEIGAPSKKHLFYVVAAIPGASISRAESNR